MAETWDIDAENREELIESAVNTAFGMSLVGPVSVAVSHQVGEQGNIVSGVHIKSLGGDTAVVPCDDPTDADQVLADIMDAVRAYPLPLNNPIR